MDQDSKVIERHSRIVEAILQCRLKDAIDLLYMQMDGVTDWQTVSRFEDLQREYGYMLQFFAGGARDDSRHSLYAGLQAKTYLLAADARIARLKPSSMTLFCQKLRQYSQNSVTTDEARLVFETDSVPVEVHENMLEKFFDSVWTSPIWSRQDAESMANLCESPHVVKSDILFAVSSLLLALFERLDPEKFLLLCRLAESEEKELSSRALTAISLVVLKYSDVLHLFPALESRLLLLSQNVALSERMARICMALLMTRQTAQIDRRMREEIIPTMLSNPKLGGLMSDVMDSEGESPEWSENEDMSKVRNSLMEMTELQMEGADVYMSTFSNLKNFPFFRKPSNWFRIFSPDQPDVRASLGDSGIEKSIIGKSMLSSASFCNSDKYSFALAFSQIPASQREIIAGQLEGQFDQEQMEELSKALPKEGEATESQAIRQYCQDLYRFFNLFSRRHEFTNPFEFNLNLLSNKYLSSFFRSSDSIYDIAVWLLRKSYFQEAAQIFSNMEANGDSHCTDYRFYQQMGYAWQRCSSWELALEAYDRADLLESGNSWTLRHLAQCQRVIGKYEKSLELLLEAERIQADNMSLQIQIGECLVDLKRYDEALQRFYKVDYLKPDYHKAWRAIAWCAFLAGRHDKASQYYTRLAESGNDGTDLLNAGHNSWVQGNVSQAVDYYRRSLSVLGHDDFMAEFDSDIPTLAEKGIDKADLPIMKDCICQN